MVCDDCTWVDCNSCPLDEHPTNSEIYMLDVGDRRKRGRAITREEAVELLVNATYSDEWQGNEQFTKANLMAIEALSERSAPRFFYAVPTSEIKTLRPKGKWIEWKKKGEFSDGRYQCSQCKHNYSFEYNFCPNCGAKMYKE